MNIAFQILELDDRLKEITIRIEHFDKHGVIPAQPVKDEPKSLSDLNTAELIKRQMTVRTYITRYKIKLTENLQGGLILLFTPGIVSGFSRFVFLGGGDS